MKLISQRELRNDNADIMRGVEDGETYTVTRRGVPVARLTPLTGDIDVRCIRAAKKRPSYRNAKRVVLRASGAVILDDLRGDR